MTGIQKSLLSYFSLTIAYPSTVLFVLELFQDFLRQGNASRSTQKNPAPTISSNSGCGNQDGLTLAEIQDGPTLAEVQDDPAPVALFYMKLMI